MFHDHPIRKAAKVFFGERILPNGRSQRVAVKLMPLKYQSVEKWKSFKRFRHQNLVGILDCGQCYAMGKKVFVVMELCKKNLSQYIAEDFQQPVKFDVFLSLFNQLLDVLEYVHKKSIIHQNINPDNILIGGDGKIRLLGFQFTEDERNQDGHHIGGFWSPEMYQRDVKLTKASDMFQAGLVAAYIITRGQHPFGSDPYEWSYNIKNNTNVDLSIVPKFDNPYFKKREELIKLLQAMLNPHPKDRPSIKTLNDFGFFKGRPTRKIKLNASLISEHSFLIW